MNWALEQASRNHDTSEVVRDSLVKFEENPV